MQELLERLSRSWEWEKAVPVLTAVIGLVLWPAARAVRGRFGKAKAPVLVSATAAAIINALKMAGANNARWGGKTVNVKTGKAVVLIAHTGSGGVTLSNDGPGRPQAVECLTMAERKVISQAARDLKQRLLDADAADKKTALAAYVSRLG